MVRGSGKPEDIAWGLAFFWLSLSRLLRLKTRLRAAALVPRAPGAVTGGLVLRPAGLSRCGCVLAALTAAHSTYVCFSSLLCFLLCLSVRIRTGHFWGPVT